MTKFSKADSLRIETAFMALAHDAREQELEEFVTLTLALNASQRSQKFPDGSLSADKERADTLISIASKLWLAAQNAITKRNIIPTAVLIKRIDPISSLEKYYISGLETHLRSSGERYEFIRRTQNIQHLRGTLANIRNGLFLEARTAAILKDTYKDSKATQGSGDQGIDCLASSQILSVQSWCRSPDDHPGIKYLGNHLHIIASCKAKYAVNRTPLSRKALGGVG